MMDSYKLFKSLNNDRKKIFNLIQKNGAMTKNEILNRTGMKLTTLNRIMNPIEKDGIIVQKCIGESTGGRRPILYDVNVCGFYIIGIDISKMYVQVSIVNLRMEIFYKKISSIDISNSVNYLIDRIQNIINNAYVELRLDMLKLIGIGVAIETGLWSNVSVKKMLEKRLNCNIIIENGANSAAIAEHLYGSGKQFNNLAYFDCGPRIREGTILHGQIVRSVNDSEYVFENMLSLKKESMNLKRIFIDIQKNETLSKSIILNFANAFAKSIKLYADLLDLKCVILNGPLANLDLFYKICVDYINREIVLKRGGYFKENAISIGTAALVIESCIKN
ncbi:ROK family transcriptional regulator [Clostridium tyrobutyricum]|uniref:ROK family transcriptional regulator n=1 Tax=Clostridium tyrobutyricum TaxID=1519 RepID=UPI001C38DF62|nr:ROK family transcriptional regulator [Clostridium tyrobutyricum]MBV4428062.1 ROK family transcriptional regulator [Clostridium tyrobutyricum]MBV4432763.1 ROK family transcriptional regulator [Clostridium tyrobutyricum]MBV4443509.1 ROK family transcriptional regulator [Clostridium tyrobutyricum]